MADQVIDVNPPSVGRREVFIKSISWAAVFSGALVALAVEVLFLTFGSFIGFRMSPGTEANAWSVAWTFFGAFISFFIGGWVAGSLGGNPATGRAHGLVTWGLATVATFVFVAIVSWGLLSQTVGVVKTAALAASNIATANAAPTSGAIAPGNRARAGSANRVLEQQANQAINQAQEAWPYQARVLANKVSNFSLFIWIAFMIAVLGALVGGAAGAPKVIPTARL
ncbi:MAG TPA: hypothetical protein VMA31_16090 [Bryobacteraceae bacterium]|nr:hypothetical protein [Bryobacteraceae bacterium]